MISGIDIDDLVGDAKTYKISTDGSTCVDTTYYWQPLETAPHGVKLQLLSKYGVAVYGVLSATQVATGFWESWSPLPKRKPQQTT